MSYNIQLSENFKKEAKRLTKKYPSLKEELARLFLLLEEDPAQGTPLGKGVFKIRIAIAAKNRGKSGGGRVLSFLQIEESSVLLFSIYDKSEKSTVSSKEISTLLKGYI